MYRFMLDIFIWLDRSHSDTVRVAVRTFGQRIMHMYAKFQCVERNYNDWIQLSVSAGAQAALIQHCSSWWLGADQTASPYPNQLERGKTMSMECISTQYDDDRVHGAKYTLPRLGKSWQAQFWKKQNWLMCFIIVYLVSIEVVDLRHYNMLWNVPIRVEHCPKLQINIRESQLECDINLIGCYQMAPKGLNFSFIKYCVWIDGEKSNVERQSNRFVWLSLIDNKFLLWKARDATNKSDKN